MYFHEVDTTKFTYCEFRRKYSTTHEYFEAWCRASGMLSSYSFEQVYNKIRKGLI